MIITDFNIDNSSVTTVKAKVELYNGSTLVKTCTCSDVLQDFTVDRAGESKFFGFGICHKATVNLIDIDRELTITKENTIKIALGDGTNFIYPYPTLFIDEVERDEDTNTITLTAYDALYRATAHTWEELELETPYDIYEVIGACSEVLGSYVIKLENIIDGDPSLDTVYSTGANFEGTENLRTVLNAIAEVTQTIYYFNHEDRLVFKRLDKAGEPVARITKEDYFKLKSGANTALTSLWHTTELGDNLSTPDTPAEGATQYIRDNPFWELREDTAALLEAAFAVVDGLTINQFTCEAWLGNYLLEIGDKIEFEAEDGGAIVTYLLDDSISFDGFLEEATQWSYSESEGESYSNPTSLGDVINQTYAFVDKANKEITQAITESKENKNSIVSIKADIESINNTVSETEKLTQEQIKKLGDNYTTLTHEVSTKMTKEDFNIEISKTLNLDKDGNIQEVKTSTGYTFGADGLNIKSSESDINTTITNNGMTVKQGSEEVLKANAKGVQAKNLEATTYLIIANNSRLEEWNGRAACFWIAD